MNFRKPFLNSASTALLAFAYETNGGKTLKQIPKPFILKKQAVAKSQRL
jgi:hypothetical protein